MFILIKKTQVVTFKYGVTSDNVAADYVYFFSLSVRKARFDMTTILIVKQPQLLFFRHFEL